MSRVQSVSRVQGVPLEGRRAFATQLDLAQFLDRGESLTPGSAVLEGGYGEASLLEKEAVNSRFTEFRKSDGKNTMHTTW
jgi:hypothetical protein